MLKKKFIIHKKKKGWKPSKKKVYWKLILVEISFGKGNPL